MGITSVKPLVDAWHVRPCAPKNIKTPYTIEGVAEVDLEQSPIAVNWKIGNCLPQSMGKSRTGIRLPNSTLKRAQGGDMLPDQGVGEHTFTHQAPKNLPNGNGANSGIFLSEGDESGGAEGCRQRGWQPTGGTEEDEVSQGNQERARAATMADEVL